MGSASGAFIARRETLAAWRSFERRGVWGLALGEAGRANVEEGLKEPSGEMQTKTARGKQSSSRKLF